MPVPPPTPSPFAAHVSRDGDKPGAEPLGNSQFRQPGERPEKNLLGQFLCGMDFPRFVEANRPNDPRVPVVKLPERRRIAGDRLLDQACIVLHRLHPGGVALLSRSISGRWVGYVYRVPEEFRLSLL